MKVYFVADGPRDEVAISRIVQKILETPIVPMFKAWKQIRLTRRRVEPKRGYRAKLRFAIRSARDAQCDGLVATLDTDRDQQGARLTAMMDARQADRENQSQQLLPTALGEATPHLEAWLLDDGVTVKSVLRIPATDPIPTLPQRDPKAALDGLMDMSVRNEEPKELLGEIASEMEFSRCQHSLENGLAAFIEDLKQEFSGTETHPTD